MLAFEAPDKYVRVLAASGEYWLRTPLRELQPRLDPQVFWQVHRGTVERDDAGRLRLALYGRSERLAVSRVHAGLFRAM
ncbi:MAG: hypothetical protein GAK38_03092 [Xylophilus sp.]|nr:MAG: hypothetical protein GAK38_03092 [Xylophilus sp.]